MSQQPTASVDVCNLALDRIGIDQCENIVQPTTDQEIVCARHYDQTRREILRRFIPNFARTATILNLSNSAPVLPDFLNAYTLPADFIRLLTLGNPKFWQQSSGPFGYEISDGFIYSNAVDEPASVSPAALTLQAPTLTIAALYRSGDLVAGVAVPAGITAVQLAGAAGAIAGAQYLVSGVVGAVQANGGTYQFAAGNVGATSLYFMQTSAGQNFSSAAWGVYAGGGVGVATYLPAGTGTVAGGLRMSYIRDFETVPLFDPMFVNVLKLQLAANIAYKFTLKQSLISGLLKELEDAILSFAAVHGQEKPPQRIQRSRVRDVRRAGGIFRNQTIINGP